MGLDFLAAVSSYPRPDDKIRTTSLKVQGGGNASNALTCVARLGLSPRAISKVADDTQGRAILEELQADGVDTSFVVVSEEGNSPFTYIIVDNQTSILNSIARALYLHTASSKDSFHFRMVSLFRSHIVAACDGFLISRGDIACLQPQTPLLDDVINVMAAYMYESKNHSWFFPTHFGEIAKNNPTTMSRDQWMQDTRR